MVRLFLNPLFIIGLVVKVYIILSHDPVYASGWYAAFLDYFIVSPSLFPWQDWLQAGGSEIAFPYGYAMLAWLTPLSWVSRSVFGSVLVGYQFSLFLADLITLFWLLYLLKVRKTIALIVYWLSPISILATYYLGFNDVVAAMFFVIGTQLILDRKLILSGAFIATSITAKLSMTLGLPFFLLYFFHQKNLRSQFSKFSVGLVCLSLVLLAPQFITFAGSQMFLSSPALERIFDARISLSDDQFILMVPLIYSILLYMVWRLGLVSFTVLMSQIGLGFLVIILFSNSPPGWFLWALPFLTMTLSKDDRLSVVLFVIFSLLATSHGLVYDAHFQQFLDLSAYKFNGIDGNIFDFSSILKTMSFAAGTLFVFRTWRRQTNNSGIFNSPRSPLVIGIVGDSGVGKDTLAEAITGIFGKNLITQISGDDYHVWDRRTPIWQALTHLNPAANDLDLYSEDLMKLSCGEQVSARSYNHETGLFEKPSTKKPNNIILATGLHVFLFPKTRNICHLKIYLDMDEGLRQHFKFKRDVFLRGHQREKVATSIARRLPDAKKFIWPQAQYSDIKISLVPLRPLPEDVCENDEKLPLKLIVESNDRSNIERLIRVLVSVCGVNVDLSEDTDGRYFTLTIEGNPNPEDIAFAATILAPELIEFLDPHPDWKGGISGVTLVVIILYIADILKSSGK